MKYLLIFPMLLVQSFLVMAQNCCVNDSIVREIQFPLTEQDTKPVFYYFNNEWLPGACPDMIPTDSIQKMEVKNDAYDNCAVFLTVSTETVAELKEKLKGLFINFDPQCEFPGGNGKLKEWLDANLQIPEGYKGCERVLIRFVVQPDGTVTDPSIFRPSKNDAANKEALRLVNALPKFRVRYCTPRKYKLHYTLPITFREPDTIYIRGGEVESRGGE